ncbi:MAG TPA: two-component regulator propeller domain-containing protein [Bacteroidales bacterium]|nr:two-component regulator propeller domain-containing protein [Bacteroidales bacterium]
MFHLFNTVSYANNGDLRFIHLSTDNGISNTEVYSVVQDKEGFIWIGTADGLNRYDGRSFKIYRKDEKDSTSLYHDLINCLFVDSRGTLWVGTDRGGVSMYDKEKDRFINHLSDPDDTTSILNNRITSITEDSKGDMWIASYFGLNLLKRNSNKFVRYSDDPVLVITDEAVRILGSKNIYKPYINELSKLKGSKIRRNDLYNRLKEISADLLEQNFYDILAMIDPNGILHNDIRALYTDPSGNIWIGYSIGFVSVLNPETGKFNHMRFVTPKAKNSGFFFITSFCSSENEIWVSTRGEGIWILDQETAKWRKFDKIPDEFINMIMRDSVGNIWMGGQETGLVLYRKSDSKIISYKYDQFDDSGISGNIVTCIYEDKQKNLWVGSLQADLNFVVKANPFLGYKQDHAGSRGLTNKNVSSVLEDGENKLWVGYYNAGGIDIIDRKTGNKRFIRPQKETGSGLGEGTVHCIYKDGKSNIWVGTYFGGLQMYDRKTGKFKSYRHNPEDEESIAGNDVRSITEDKHGNLWIAIHGGGVDKFNPSTAKFEHHLVNYGNLTNTISSDWVLSIYCDTEDNIWVGTIDGISVIDQRTIKVRHYRNQPNDTTSLSNNFVYSICQDSKGNMWFGTASGLNLFNKKYGTFSHFTIRDGLSNNKVTGIIEDQSGNLWLSTYKGLCRFTPGERRFKNFDIIDGLVTDEFILPGGFKSQEGEIFFGGKQGVICFLPGNIIENKYKPPVYITAFKLFNKPVETVEAENVFSLEKQSIYSHEITLKYNQNVFTLEFAALNYIEPEKNLYAYRMLGFDKDWNFIENRNDVTYTNLPPGKYAFQVKAANNDGVWNDVPTTLNLTVIPPWYKTAWAFLLYILLIATGIAYLRYTFLLRERFKRKIELERIEARQQHELDLMKLRFFTNISHEFRTPLTMILAPLEKPFHLLSKEKLESNYKLIYKNASRLLRLINQLMDLRKLEAGGLTLEASENDIIRFVREISSTFQIEATERSVNFQVVTNLASLSVWFDRDKLDKILYNLIANAFKFTDNGKNITVYISVKGPEENTYGGDLQFVEIIIEDSGIGIDKDDLVHIFDSFYQAETAKKNLGSGVGLALTKELIEIHNGILKAESIKGKGSRFIILLPLGKQHLKPYQITNEVLSDSIDLFTKDKNDLKPSPIRESIDLKKTAPVLLIIEDHPDLRQFIKNEFEQSFNVMEASDGIEGFESAINNIPDIIISDIMMPGLDGIELCKRLKSDEKTSHIPVILLTARTASEQVIEGLETGADDYIPKPFSISILRARVQNLLESRRLLRRQFSKLPDISEVTTTTSLDQKFLNRASKFIENNISNSEYDAHAFSGDMGMSRSQLYRKLQALTGYSVNEFMRNMRLKKGAELLLTTENSVSNIAFEVGFKEISYFVKCFTDYYKLSPTKYRVTKGKK